MCFLRHAPIIIGISVLLVGEALAQSPIPPELSRGSLFGSMHLAAASDVLLQTFTYSKGARTIFVRRHERETPGEAWKLIQDSYSTSFGITAIDSREGGEELYVAGTNDQGEDVIERWTFPVRDGRWVMRHGGSPPPIGTPAGTFSVQTFIKGGSYVAPAGSDWVEPDRREIVKGSFGRIRALEVDPEARYLLVLTHVDSSLHLVDLAESPKTLQLLYSGVQIPHLTQCYDFGIWDHPVLGRIAVAGELGRPNELPTDRRTVFIDQQNDGIFESHETLGGAEWSAKGYDFDWKPIVEE